jgi:CRP-like cAMP-binding protein
VLEQLGPNPFGRRMVAGLAGRLHGLVRDVEAYSLRSSQERLIGYLLAELPEDAVQGEAEVRLTPGKSVLASRLNMTPEHFSRLLHELAAAGLIQVNGRAIRVPDVARLRGGTPAS